MRGLVMLIMTLDHSAIFYNPGRLHSDSPATYVPGSVIGWDQFFTRWITHLCAPTFLFLAGASLALSVQRRQATGQGEREIDRDLLIRGALLIALDLVWISTLAQGRILQVLYAIGASFLAMIPLRRLPVRAAVALAVFWICLGELVTFAIWDPHAGNASVLAALFVARHVADDGRFFYPMVPWLSVMLLGWGFGHVILRRGSDTAMRLAAIGGAGALVLFAVVRGVNAYGNMGLYRDDGSLLQWLNVSKYPPSATFVLLELGLSLLLLAAFFWGQTRVKLRDNGPLTVFGQAALFFYVIHQATLFGIGKAFGFNAGTLTQTYAAMVIAWIVLYPICRLYRSYKRTHPKSLARYL
jgi:uncharacterized membrane protein